MGNQPLLKKIPLHAHPIAYTLPLDLNWRSMDQRKLLAEKPGQREKSSAPRRLGPAGPSASVVACRFETARALNCGAA
ncbi:Hypothetical protein NTJ_06401 [Nesidiocoris tenuis]|uniref:Uncharacterized protein n=1 Tax=Nesidiocoris tenuis TaxID=355587 RepID=A0ABN7AT68_9HEMI|nr:Hypothetical protein NTJ_06401 [Nesidiocoris tenuis]